MYDVSTRTVPLGWETSVFVVVDYSVIVTCTMNGREQYHLFGKLVVLLSLNHRLLLHVGCIDEKVPLVSETSGFVVVDSLFIVTSTMYTSTMYRQTQYHLDLCTLTYFKNECVCCR